MDNRGFPLPVVQRALALCEMHKALQTATGKVPRLDCTDRELTFLMNCRSRELTLAGAAMFVEQSITVGRN